MKKNSSNNWGDVGVLKLMADVLHTIMTLRGQIPTDVATDSSAKVVNERLDKSLRRLYNSVDYKARKAEKLLKKGLSNKPSKAVTSLCIAVSPRVYKSGK